MKPSHQTLLLSKKDIITIINHFGVDNVMDELIHRLEIAISEYNPSNTDIPARSGFNYNSPNPGLVEWMPVYQKGEEIVIKVVGYHPNNPKTYNLPTIISTISTYDTSNGHLKSLMDGVLLTALRTGASTAVATKALAQSDSKTLGLIGCGAQAVTQLHALCRDFDFETVLIFDVDEATMSSFDKRTEALNLNCIIVKSDIKNIVQSSDIICTATSIDVHAGPLFDNLETVPHVHINAVGSDFPGKVELPISLLKSSKVIPDFYNQAIIEGECQQLQKDDIYKDWVEILNNSAQYASLKGESTVFDSTGWALEDYVVSKLFTEYATSIGAGSYIEIESLSSDVKNPYAFISSAFSVEKAIDLIKTS